MENNTKLFTPITIRGVTIPNRIVLSPLCMYSANDGVASDWQFAHLSTFARARTGLIFAEASAVEARGRITPGCLGIWTDEQAEALKPILDQMMAGIITALENTPPELSADLVDMGLVLTGGGALLKNIDKLISKETGLPVQIADDPLSCVAIGAGKALEQEEMFSTMMSEY